MASVGSSITGSGTVSTWTFRLPCQVTARTTVRYRGHQPGNLAPRLGAVGAGYSTVMRRVATAMLAAGALLAGCGGQEGDAAAVARDFLASLSAGDATAACASLAQATREKLEKDEAAPCAEALAELDLRAANGVSDTEVFVSEARVRLANGEYAFLGRTPDGWKVSAAGCKPTAPEEPYDCELEA